MKLTFYVYLCVIIIKINVMKTIKINNLSAKNIKKYLKLKGVKVLRCAQNGNGVLVTIVNEKSNIDLAMNFFSDYEITNKFGQEIRYPKSNLSFIDFGTLYNVTII